MSVAVLKRKKTAAKGRPDALEARLRAEQALALANAAQRHLEAAEKAEDDAAKRVEALAGRGGVAFTDALAAWKQARRDRMRAEVEFGG